jgi:hypothetical protein
MTDQHEPTPDAPSGDYDAAAAHGSEENPLEHVGEPIADPLIDGSHGDAAQSPTPEG